MPEEKPKLSPQVSMKLGELAAVVDARADHEIDNASRAEAIRVMIARYEAIVARDLPVLSAGEWKLVADTLNGTVMRDYPDPDGDRLRMIWAGISDGIRLDGLDKKWDVNGVALIEKIRSLTHGQLVALVDTVERFWIAVARKEQPKVPGEG